MAIIKTKHTKKQQQQKNQATTNDGKDMWEKEHLYTAQNVY
jgi:hypothetical protein